MSAQQVIELEDALDVVVVRGAGDTARG